MLDEYTVDSIENPASSGKSVGRIPVLKARNSHGGPLDGHRGPFYRIRQPDRRDDGAELR
jgi:hypothetical protein